MPIRLKVVRRKEEQISKVKGLMDMFKVPNSNSCYQYQYQPIGASTSTTIDPKIEKVKGLMHMFGLRDRFQ